MKKNQKQSSNGDWKDLGDFLINSKSPSPEQVSNPAWVDSQIRGKFFWASLWFLYAVSILLTYAFLHMHYRPNDVDDGWSLSYLYNYFYKGITTDLNFGDPFNGVQFFGKFHALLVAFILELLGWTRTNGHLLSIFFMGTALVLWFFILRSLGYSRTLALSFLFTASLLDPFFTAATSTRLEAFEFLLITLAMTAFLLRWWMASMLITWLAIESHPIGVMAFFYMGAAWAASPSLRSAFQKRLPLNLIKISFGFFTGACSFTLLHYEVLTQIPGLLFQKNLPGHIKSYGPLFDYFFLTKYLRHLPELLLFATALILFLRKRIYLQEKFTWLFLISMAAAALLIRRPNFHYALFLYPSLLLLLLSTAEALKRLPLILLGLWLFLVPQYFLAYVQNRSYDFQKQVRTLSATIPDDPLPVLANANEWFAFYHRPYYYYNYLGDYRKLELKEFYLIEDNDYRSMNGDMKQWIQSRFKEEVLKKLVINGQTYEVKKMRL
jgi:hypothetical protein